MSTGYPLHSPVSSSLPSLRQRVPSRFNWTLPRLGSAIWNYCAAPADGCFLEIVFGFVGHDAKEYESIHLA